MSTSNTFLTLVAFMLLSTIMVGFYRNLARGGDTVVDSQSGITELTLATTYMELAQGLAFDEVTVDSFLTTTQLAALTDPSHLGVDNPPPSGEPTEVGFGTIDDIDDLNNYAIVDTSFKNISGIYKTTFSVKYVNPSNISQTSTVRTFVKRVDMSIWRIAPASKDTLKHSIIMGYFHFS